jgi:hypothetical protein
MRGGLEAHSIVEVEMVCHKNATAKYLHVKIYEVNFNPKTT